MISELMLLKSCEKLACFNWSTTVLNNARCRSTSVRRFDSSIRVISIARASSWTSAKRLLSSTSTVSTDFRLCSIARSRSAISTFSSALREFRLRSWIRVICSWSSLTLCVLGAVVLGQLLLLLDQVADVVGRAELRRARAQVCDQAARIATELADRVRDRPERTVLAGELLSQLELISQFQGLLACAR